MKRSSEDILLRPLLTEKAMLGQEEGNRYYFEVRKDANKLEVKKAVEKMFEVRVTKVNTMLVPGKWKRLGMFRGRGGSWKKAVVTLHEGDVIELYEGV